MVNLFSKGRILVLGALMCMANSTLAAWDDCCDVSDENRLYVGGFGGCLFSSSPKVYQMGTAFFTEAEGGPLAVFAQGTTNRSKAVFAGAQIGYEWSRNSGFCGCSDFTIAPALELEAFFYKHKKRGHLTNPTDRLDEHDFLDKFKINSNVLLLNAVISINNSLIKELTPYVGGGIGAARLWVKNASSLQTDPPEVGINHFNSHRSDSDWTFAAQVKAGLRYNMCNSLHVFIEYRYLYLDSTHYILGSTVYDNHAPTSPWNVKVHDIHYNAVTIGAQYDL